MRIYTKAGDLAFSTLTFSDGQPHFKLETYETEFRTVTIELAIRNPVDLFTVLLVADQLRRHGYTDICLDIRYLLAARMDRAISWAEPFSLDVVARLINGAGFSRVRILDAHSSVATSLIRNASNVLPFEAVRQAVSSLGLPHIVCPDKGAYDRVWSITHALGLWDEPFIQCSKVRDPSTGGLTGFKAYINEGPGRSYRPFRALILDDICDGGGTFIGLAKELRAKGATQVNLFVTHGIFSKGLPLEGVDRIFTTDSYFEAKQEFGRNGELTHNHVVVIPISMKDLK